MEVLFVHGALVRDGDWWWRLTAERLTAAGVASRSVALPSCGEMPGVAAGSAGLREDAAALRAALDETGGGTIVVGHSYGGTVIAEAGAHPAVAHLVYISSYLPDAGLPQGEIMSGETDPVAVAPNDDGTIGVSGFTADSFAARFLNDVPDVGVRAEAWGRVTSQGLDAFSTPTSQEGWKGVDSTYLVCSDDRSTSVGLQRWHAARATRAVELPTGHHPFLSRPDLVADEIIRIASSS